MYIVNLLCINCIMFVFNNTKKLILIASTSLTFCDLITAINCINHL